jgi:LysM repeat protein
MRRTARAAVAGVILLTSSSAVGAQSLRGSPQAMQQQHRMAVQHDYTFLQTSAHVRRFVDNGLLVRVPGNADYELAAVSHPYARPAVKLFVERLSAQYRSACGEKLIVTSLTRPVSEQPRNASALSVHPAGMAVDLRISRKTQCRQWLERTLLSLERQGVLNAIRENNPPHYHVALYPTRYTQYVAQVTSRAGSAQLASALQSAGAGQRASSAQPAAAQAPSRSTAVQVAANTAAPGEAAASRGPSDAEQSMSPADERGEVLQYRVNRGDSLWSIARRHGTTVETLKELNGLKSTAIVAGQVIVVPGVTVGAES